MAQQMNGINQLLRFLKMTEFQREERYVVIKISKMHPHPTFRAKHLSALKREHGDALVDCVVVERDWPEYEYVWSMLESRITGAPTLDHVNCHSTIRKQSEQIDDLRAQLAEMEQKYRNELAKRLVGEVKMAERDALLREWLELHRRQQQPVTLHERTEAALSASAEPSAPAEIDERAAFEAHRKSLGLCIKRMPGSPDLYESQAANGGWTAWQARAAMERKS